MNIWLGRIGVTCNCDAESATTIPETTLSNEEKLIIVKTVDKPTIDYPHQRVIKQILAHELPFFCRWLLDFEIPKELMGSSRYGVMEYADPELVSTSKHSSLNAGFAEILNEWKAYYFGVENKEKAFWTGTAIALLRSILDYDPRMEQIMRSYSHSQIQRRLASLMASGYNILIENESGDTRIWKIMR